MRRAAAAATVLAVVAAAATALAAPAAAAPRTLYAYAGGTGTTAGCPATTTVGAQCSLTGALSQAVAGDTIALATAGGTAPFRGNWTVSTPSTTAAAPLMITAASGLAQAPVLDGNLGSAAGCSTASCAGPILTVGSGVFLTVSGITLQNGHAATGAAIDNGDNGSGGTVTVSGATFSDNTATYGGGAISNADAYGSTGTLTVTNSLFRGNDAGGEGGAITNGYSATGAGTLTVTGSTFLQNYSAGNGGGAIANSSYYGTAALTVTGSTFTANRTAGAGGAIAHGYGAAAAGTLTVTSSTFAQNRAATGGAIAKAFLANGATGSGTVSTSTFTGNTAQRNGGAIDTGTQGSSGTLLVNGSTFSGNTAGFFGGAVNNGYAGGSSVTIRNSSLISNSASTAGGAVMNAYAGSGSATVLSSVLRDNSSTTGGAVDTADQGTGTLTVVASSLVGNRATTGGAINSSDHDGAGTTAVIGSTLADNGTSSTAGRSIRAAGTGVMTVAGDLIADPCVTVGGTWFDDGHNATADPSCLRDGAIGDVTDAHVATRLGLVAQNLAGTQSAAPLSTSPAVGNVPNGATAPHAPAAVRQLCPRLDQAFLPTPQGATCSAGAVDMPAPDVTATPGDGRITLSWPAANPAGRPVNGYYTYLSTTSGAEKFSGPFACTGGTARSCTVTGLKNGTTYYAAVYAADAGLSWSQEVRAVPVPVPTLTVNRTYPVVAKGAKVVLSGKALAGRTVALRAGGTTLASTTVTSKGTYSFTRTLTAATSFTVVSLGRTSKTLTVAVVALTLGVAGTQPLAKGTYTFTGHAPRGRPVALQQDGRTIATTTTPASTNAYSFRRSLTATHTYRIVCDGVTSASITVRVR